MFNFRYAEKKDIEKIASFIAQCNSNLKNHIGYCGSNKQDIYSCLQKDQDLLPSFTLAYDEDELVGLLGYDYYDNTAELWGPFVSISFDFKSIANLLWEKMTSRLPKDTKYHGFPNISNNLCEEFYISKAMIMKGNHEILECVLKDISSIECDLLKEHDYEKFISLHDSVFPKTYYTGKEIVSMLNEDNVVIVSKVDNKLVGYAFVNIDASFDGNIEFIGVKSKNRREGHGRKLIKMALGWFRAKGSEKLLLCVDSKNEKAISLYKKSGFSIKYSLKLYGL